jgi:hypothetical protein
MNDQILSTDDLIARIARAVVNQITPQFPHEIELWSVERVASYFNKAVPVAQRSILCKPGFPKPVKTEKGARPLYFAKEVVEWANSCRDKH